MSIDVAAAIATLKATAKALKEAGRLDLYQQILGLMQTVQADVTENTRLALEVDRLSRELAEARREMEKAQRRRAMDFADDVYWVVEGNERREGPFCPNCLDGPNHLEMRMTDRKNGFLVCVGCKHSARVRGYVAPPRDPPATVRSLRFGDNQRRASEAREELQLREGAYYQVKRGADVGGPFCARCYTVDSRLMPLTPLPAVFKDVGRYECPQCKAMV